MDLADLTQITGWDNPYIQYSDQSSGTVSGCLFIDVPLTLHSVKVNVTENTFLYSDPVYAYPVIVPELFDNAFSYSGVSTIHVQGGTVNRDTTWRVIESAGRYSIDDSVTVAVGKTLRIEAGVEVYTSGNGRRLYVDGTVDAVGCSYTGYMEMEVHGGGRMNLADVSPITGSAGLITGSNFVDVLLHVYSAGVSAYGNTFSYSDPVYTYPSLTPEFYDNEFASSGVSAFHIQSATMDRDTNWEAVGTAKRYSIDGTIIIGVAKTLVIAPDVEVYASGNGRRIYTDGTL